MTDPTIYLIEANASNGTSVETLRFCSGAGYTSKPTDTPANEFYEPRVEQPGLFRQSMYAIGTTGGASTGGYGEITLMNTDMGLDYLLDLGFDGQQCVVKQGTHAMALSEFSTVLTGTIEQVVNPWNRIIFRLKDCTTELTVPVQTVLYGGTNVLPAGIDGTEDIKGKPLPRLFGVCNNVTPVCVNTSKLIYQLNNDALESISSVYDMGVPLTVGVDHADNATMQATAPGAGAFDTCLAEGLFRLGSAPVGAITADAVQGAAASDRTAGQIIKTLATEKLTASRVAAQPIIDLDKAAPYVVGLFIGADMTTAAALDILCQSVGAWWGFDNLGIFWAKQLQEPVAAQAITTLTTAEILSIERTATADSDRGVPIWRVNLDYGKNWTKQTTLAGSVTADRAAALALEYQRTKAEDATVKDLHLLAPELTVQTTIADVADGDTEASRILAMRKVRRDRLNVRVAMSAIEYPAGGYWDDEAISEMPFPRQQHCSVIAGNYLYVIGGSIVGGAESSSVIRLDLSNPTGSWDDAGVTDLPTTRKNAAAVVFNNFLYVIAGSSGRAASASVIRLDLSNPTGAWDDAGVTDMPVQRVNHTAVIFGNYVYVAGGTSLASVVRLDLSNPTGSWDDAGVTDMPAERRGHSAIVHGSYLYVIGGLVNSVNSASAIRLDLSNPTGAWDDVGVTDLPAAKSFHASCVFNGFLYVLGGYNGTVPVPSVIRLDLLNPSGAWDDVGVTDMPAERQYLSVEAINDSLYTVGGYTAVIEQSNTWRLRTNDNPEDTAQLTSMGRTMIIKHPRYGYTSGRPMRIIGAESDHANRMLLLDLWG